MNKYQIRGGNPLHGTIEISGAKNAAVAILPAALLVDGVCRIENVPQISDVTLILQILRELGAEVRLVNATTVEVDCSHIRNRQVPYELGRKIRASYYLLGALLGRFGWAEKTPEGRWHFTPEGFLISNQLIGDLLERQEQARLDDTLERAKRRFIRP